MKKLLVVSSLLIGMASASAQRPSVDSLQKILLRTSEDTTRVFTLLKISDAYYYSHPDSAIRYAQQAYNLAKNKEFPLGEAQSLAILGGLLYEMGNYVKALETHLKAFEIHEKRKDSSGMAACYNNIALIYQEQEDYLKAVSFYLMAKNIFEEKKQKYYLLQTLINIGYNYERMDLLDSALFYQDKAFELGFQIKSNEDIAVVLVNLGNIHYKLHHNEVALSHYKSGIPFALQASDKQTLANAKYGIAKIHGETGNIDSSILYAKQSYISSIECSFPKGVINASELLSSLYKTRGKMDSAYWYLKKTVNTRDTMFNAEIVRKVQIISTNEQLRQQEKKAEQQRFRSNLIMYALIGGFVVLLIAAAFLFRIKQIKREHLIRAKLSKDLHDDLGSTLNSIKVYTNLALIQKEEQHLERIKESTQEAISGVRDIIWIMNDHKDNVADLLVRLRTYAIPLCEANEIRYIQQVNDGASSYKLKQEEKRNLYLIIKEAFNNTIKYAKAYEVCLSMGLSDKGKLFIQIKDMGQGFNLLQANEGNGLRNMKFRAEQIGYGFMIRSVINQGTLIELKKQ